MKNSEQKGKVPFYGGSPCLSITHQKITKPKSPTTSHMNRRPITPVNSCHRVCLYSTTVTVSVSVLALYMVSWISFSLHSSLHLIRSTYTVSPLVYSLMNTESRTCTESRRFLEMYTVSCVDLPSWTTLGEHPKRKPRHTNVESHTMMETNPPPTSLINSFIFPCIRLPRQSSGRPLPPSAGPCGRVSPPVDRVSASPSEATVATPSVPKCGCPSPSFRRLHNLRCSRCLRIRDCTVLLHELR